MAITNGYTDLATFKKQYPVHDTEDDARLNAIITAVSRAIDNITDRRFFQTSEARYYTPQDTQVLFVEDFTGITTLKTDEDDDGTYETTWTTSDYHSQPFNAALDNRPYTWLEVSANGDYTFPKQIKSVELTATFGYWTSTPPEVEEACLLGSGRIFKRRDAVFGIAGTNALGVLQVVQGQLMKDPDFMLLVAPFMRGK